MAKKVNALISRILPYLQLLLAVAALVVLIYTAISLGLADAPAVRFVRDSVWRIVCCGCISLIFPYLAITQLIKEGKKND